MRSILAISFLLIFSFTGIVKVGMVCNYINKFDLYQSELCVNQEVKTLDCNGKCQLTKELQQVDEKKECPINPIETEHFAFGPFILNNSEAITTPLISTCTVSKFNGDLLFYSSFLEDISTPPPQYFIFS